MMVNLLYPNSLKYWIKKRGYRLYEVADHVRISSRSLTDYCAGRLAIPHATIEAIATLLECSVYDLLNADRQSPVFLQGDNMDKKRRELLRVFSIGGALLSFPLPLVDWDRIEASINRPALVDETLVTNLEAVNIHYWNLYKVASSKGSVLEGTVGHLKTLVAFLQDTRFPSLHKRLCVLASDVSQLVGEIFFDLQDHASAQAAYSFAVVAAKEGCHNDLWASALTRNSYLPLYDEAFEDALPLVQEAGRVIKHGDSKLSTKYWIASVVAEVQAGLGQPYATRQTLDTAAGVLAVNVEESPPWLRFDGSRLQALKGTCHIRLGDPNAAVSPLEEALSLATTPRRRAMILTDLAQVSAMQGEVEGACEYASEAAGIAIQSSSSMLWPGLRKVRTQLQPYAGTKHVKNLDLLLSVAK
jgi:tetratricopeptide (TPR) repeat protein